MSFIAAVSLAASTAGCGSKLLGRDAAILVSPETLAFGPVTLGTPQQIRVSVSNTGSAPLMISAIKVATDPNHELAVTGFVSDCEGAPRSSDTTLAPAECARFSVNWSPAVAHAASGSVEIDSTDLQNPIVTLPVSGTATAPLLQVCVLKTDGTVDPAACSTLPGTVPTVDFSSVQPGQSATRTVRVLNQGNGALAFHAAPKISATVGTPAAFTLSGTIPGNTLAAGASADLTLTASSTTAGMLKGELDLSSNDLVSPQLAVPLQVDVASWKVCVDPAAGLDFGPVMLGQSATKQLTFTNCGTTDLAVTTFAFAASAPTTTQLALTSGTLPASGSTFAAGASITLAFTYTPTAVQSDAAGVTYALTFGANLVQGAVPLMGEGVTCDGKPGSPVLNACGLCAGPTITNVGGTCTATSGCASTLACNTAGNGTVCTDVAHNACGGCEPLALAPGAACSAMPSGCASTIACNGMESASCTNVPLNACGGCSSLAHAPGGTCSAASGCASTYSCSGEDDTACTPVVKNACGVCGGATVTGLGTSCTASNGCASTLACNATNNGTQCTAVAKNECGVCGGASVSGVGQTCSGANGCTATGTCSPDGLSLTCDAPAYCDLATHVVFSQISGYGPSTATSQAGEYDEFVELYNPTSSAIDLSGYTFWLRISDKTTGFWSKLGPVAAAGQTIAPHGYWLGVYGGSIGSTYTGTVAPDFHYSTNTTNMDRSHGQLALWLTSAGTPTNAPAPSDPGFIDFVGYGSTIGTSTNQIAVWDGASPAPGPAVTSTAAIIRKAFPASTAASLQAGGADSHSGNGVGTDNNGFDWVAIDPRNPRNSQTTPAP